MVHVRRLRFACEVPPGAAAPEAFKSDVLVPLLGENQIRAAKIRRLFAQAYATAVADTERFSAQRPDEVVTMHPAECEDRGKIMAKKMTGFMLEGANDPSFELIDHCSNILLKAEARYSNWENAQPFFRACRPAH